MVQACIHERCDVLWMMNRVLEQLLDKYFYPARILSPSRSNRRSVRKTNITMETGIIVRWVWHVHVYHCCTVSLQNVYFFVLNMGFSQSSPWMMSLIFPLLVSIPLWSQLEMWWGLELAHLGSHNRKGTGIYFYNCRYLKGRREWVVYFSLPNQQMRTVCTTHTHASAHAHVP